MTGLKWILLGTAGLAAVVISVWALVIPNVPLRTTALLTGAAQRPYTQMPTIDYPRLAGRHLVNLALGRDVNDTNALTQVLALNVACDLSAASLVVFDQTVSNTVATVATSLSFDAVQSRISSPTFASELGSSNEIVRFITRLQIQPSGNTSNALLGGVLTVAGRAHRDVETGCLVPVPLQFDTDQYDQTFLDKKIPQRQDPDTAKLIARTGLAYVVGVVNVVSEELTNTVIVPAGNLNIRRSAEQLK